MKSFRHRLPPLNSLMVFEAAARHGNFTAAAKELHVSQAAVSKQIMLLEDHLGVTLFERSGRRVLLTARGQLLQEKVNASFNYLADSVEGITAKQQDRPVLTLSANTATSHFWLSNAINEFYRAHPGHPISFRVITSDLTRDQFSDDVDIALAYDPGTRIGWSMIELFAEELFPVAAPDYLERHPIEGDDPAILFGHDLLDFERIEPNWINWKIWLTRLGQDCQGLQIAKKFNNYTMLIDAAERGQGVTLGARYLLDAKLEQGSLTKVMDVSIQTGRGYFLALNEKRPLTDDLRLVYNWFWQQNENFNN
ncbi:LysR substrate-binding domain-containing protein [Aestuariispira insulae]|nr:LysR substrate-binding domain-containing protein [Aestuariispira insulae]